MSLFIFKCGHSRKIFKRSYLFVFIERGKEGEREGEKHPCERETSPGAEPAAQACVLTGDGISDL